MRDLNALVAGVVEDLADVSRMNAELGVDSSEWVEVRRDDLEALLAATRQHADCHTSWLSLPSQVMAGVRTGLAGSGGRA